MGGEIKGSWGLKPQSKVAYGLEVKPVNILEYFGPMASWVKQAAEDAVELRPRPCQQHLIHYFRRVSFQYCSIVMGKSKERIDPVEKFVYERLMERVKQARSMIEDPKGSFNQLQQKADSRDWSSDLFERRRRNLFKNLKSVNRSLCIGELRELLRDLRFILDERRLIENEIREAWRKGRDYSKGRSGFVKNLENLHDRLRRNKRLFNRLYMEKWQSWLVGQVEQVFYEIEEDILRIARYGKWSDRQLREHRREVRGTTSLVHRRKMVVVANVESWGTVDKVWAVSDFGTCNRRAHKRIKPKDNGYCNRASRSAKRRVS
ncbi:hypothetical protein KKG46_00920 [Patescibacteria group bacterium]|nr:hypothetical protein [Patescibacteria group bacterium]